MPKLKKRYTALLLVALLVPALLFLLPQIASYALVKLLADNLQVEAQIEDVVDILLGQCEQAFPALLHALENDGPPSLASQLVMMPTLGQA